MNDHDQLREQMWDLVYDLVTPDQKAALEGRIRSDPQAARLYAEVSLEADLISQAAKVADASVTLPHVEPRREKVSAGRARQSVAPAQGAGISRSLHWLAAAAASALAVVLTVGTLWQADHVERAQEHLVIAIRPDSADTLVASVPATLEIETRDPSGKPAPASIKAQFSDLAGRPLYEKQLQTDNDGKAQLPVPGEAVTVGTKLRILRDVQQQIDSLQRSSERAEDVAEVQKREELLVEAQLPVQQEPIHAPALFDKDRYVPGEEAQFRVVPQTVFRRKTPDVSTLAFRLQTPDGLSLEPTETSAVAGSGIVTGKFQLPPNAPPGRYQFAVQGWARVQPGDEASIVVAGEASPLQGTPLAADALARGGFFGPGFGGGGLQPPAPGGLGGGKPAESREGRRDRAMKLAVGTEPKAEAAAGVAGGPRDGTPVPSPPGEPARSAPGAGRGGAAPSPEVMEKLQAEKELEGAQQPMKANLLARQLGQVEVDGKQTIGNLNVDVPPEFAGKPVKIEAYFQQILLGKKLVDAEADKSRDKASEAADERQPRTTALALDPWVDGEKVDLVFQDASAPSSPPVTRRVEVPSLLGIELVEAKASYAPGETVRLFVEVKNRFDGSAVPNADLGVAVKPVTSEVDEVTQQLAKAVDDRVPLSDLKFDATGRSQATSDEDRRMNMSRRKLAPAPAPAQAEAAQVKDSTKPAPPAADGYPPAAAPVAGDVATTPHDFSLRAAGEPAFRSSLAELDGSQPLEFDSAATTTEYFTGASRPVMISNEATVHKAVEEEQAARSASQAQMALWRARLGRLLLALGVVMLLALGLAFAVQRPAKAMVWIPSLAIAVASFAVGVVWLQGQPRHPGHEVAQGNAPGAGGEGEQARTTSPASVPPESDVALMTDSEERSDHRVASREAGAAASNQTNGVEPRGGALSEGVISESTGELRKRSAVDRPDPQRLVEGLEMVPAPSAPASADQVERAPRAKLPGSLRNAPAPPDAVAKEAKPPSAAKKMSLADQEEEKKASGDASEANRKPAAGRSEFESLSSEERRLKTESKRMAEAFKEGACPVPAVADDRNKETNELFGQKYFKRAVRGVWQPLLEADENGRAVIEFTMPEEPGEYRLVLDVSGLGHVGQLQTRLRCAPQPAAPAAPAAKP
jgi:hypothetical protein